MIYADFVQRCSGAEINRNFTLIISLSFADNKGKVIFKRGTRVIRKGTLLIHHEFHRFRMDSSRYARQQRTESQLAVRGHMFSFSRPFRPCPHCLAQQPKFPKFTALDAKFRRGWTPGWRLFTFVTWSPTKRFVPRGFQYRWPLCPHRPFNLHNTRKNTGCSTEKPKISGVLEPHGQCHR